MPATQVLGPDDVRWATTRMAHEIIERNQGLDGVTLVGVQRGGVWLADLLGAEIARIEDLANAELLTNSAVRHFETSMDEAREMGAIAFFGDKYGEVVRVLEAGEHFSGPLNHYLWEARHLGHLNTEGSGGAAFDQLAAGRLPERWSRRRRYACRPW